MGRVMVQLSLVRVVAVTLSRVEGILTIFEKYKINTLLSQSIDNVCSCYKQSSGTFLPRVLCDPVEDGVDGAVDVVPPVLAVVVCAVTERHVAPQL